jgi:hypothetical protein
MGVGDATDALCGDLTWVQEESGVAIGDLDAIA